MRRKLRIIIGEFLIETGQRIRDIGWFVMPVSRSHPIARGAVTAEMLRDNEVTAKKLR